MNAGSQFNGGDLCAAPECSIVLVNYNTKMYLEMCLRSIYESGLRSSFEIVLVDNASADGSVGMVRRRFPEVRIVQNCSNDGFARAANQGVHAARGQYVLLLNTDTLVDGASIDAMVDFMNCTPDAAAAGGRLVNPDGTFQGGYARFSSITQEILIALGLGRVFLKGYPSYGESADVVEVDWLSAACLILRRQVFLTLGGLDEDYVMYSEEVDFAYRLKRAGGKMYYLPHVQTIHFGGLSSDRWQRRQRVYRGKILFYRKNYGWPREVALRFALATISVGKIALWSLALLVPIWLRRTVKEWRSNWQVFRMCVRCH